MHSVHNLLFSNDLHPSTKLILPPLDGKLLNTSEKSSLSRDINHSTLTPPAFLEPQPQTTLDTIRQSRPHRLSLSSLSSIASSSSFSTSCSSEDDTHSQSLDSFQDQDYFTSSSSSSPIIQQQRYRNILPLPSLHNSIQQNDNDNDLLNNHHQRKSSSVSIKSSLSPLTTNHKKDNHNNTSSPIISPSPPSSSLLTFWASPSPTTVEQQHEFVTKNSHIKRPRNAWIHFRCYFGQSLKAKDPTIRAEEISKRASEYWARLTSKQKKPWHIMAEQEKLAHQEAFPDYRYRPKRALPKSVVLTYQSNNDQDSDSCKKFRLA